MKQEYGMKQWMVWLTVGAMAGATLGCDPDDGGISPVPDVDFGDTSDAADGAEGSPDGGEGVGEGGDPDTGEAGEGEPPDAGEGGEGDETDSGEGGEGDAAGAGEGGEADVTPTPGVCVPSEVPCEDESILQLAFKTVPSTGLVQNEVADSGWISTIDATGGGLSPTESYVYARFTPDGLQRLDLTDEQSLADTSWDIAFRRFVIRLNSGVSGPGCTLAAPLVVFDFDGLAAVPPGTIPSAEAYFTAACAYVDDGSGLDGPNTVMSKFWTYTGCVAMTHQIYAIQTVGGSWVKARVESYYSPAVQQECQDSGTTPMGNTGSANIRLRWDFIDP